LRGERLFLFAEGKKKNIVSGTVSGKKVGLRGGAGTGSKRAVSTGNSSDYGERTYNPGKD